MLTSASDSDGMNPSGHTPPTRANAALARDAALARVGHARRWVILGTAGLSAGFAALVAASPPTNASATTAKSTSAAPARPTSVAAVTRKGQAPALPPLANASQLGLQAPGQAPGSDNSAQAAPQSAPSQQQDQSAVAPPAPSPQPGPVSGGS